MNKSLLLLLYLLATLTTSAQNLIIKDVNIIPMTADTVLRQQSVLIQKGKIVQIGNFKKLPKTKQATVIDGQGKYLMPGLADMHVHLPEADKVDRLLASNIAAGVTQIRVMNSKVPQKELRERLKNKAQAIAPNIQYSHFISRSETYTEAQADSLMRAIKNDNIDFVKLLSLSDEKTFDNLTAAATKHDVILCGHYPVYRTDSGAVMVDMEKTLKSNFKSIEHLAGYIWLQDKEQIDRALQLTKENNIYNCPTLDWDIMAYDLQYPEEYKNRLTYQLLPASQTQAWEADYAAAIDKAGGKEKVLEAKEKYQPKFDLKLRVLKRLYEADCLLLIGGDAGNSFQADGFNVYEEMMNWSKAGIDNYTILKSATVTPSQFFGESGQWGTIEVGKNADLILLDSNPLEDIRNIATVQKTIVGGKVFDTKELMGQL